MKRILSIDGGGIRGVFPAAFLASIERAVGQPVNRFFDLVVGTSTGGIIGLALGLGFTASDVLAFYEEFGRRVFSGNPAWNALRWVGLAKYRPDALRSVLEERFGDRTLGHSALRLAIPSLDLETGRVHIFKTRHADRYVTDETELAVRVAMATAAAPTYFPAHRLDSGVPLVDGGIWANNPTGLAAVEAVGNLGWRPEDTYVLSLGCTESPLDVRLGRRIGLGVLYWAYKVADVFMAGQASGSMGTAYTLLGKERVFRISPVVPPRRFALDATREIESLKGLGFSEARQQVNTLREVFFSTPAPPFIRTPTESRTNRHAP